ncbi:ARM repeat-containing protein [Hypoxylon fragiforme]|uniref:ARM repeat-containing protein n=1 Tax=Hypoxylon fragiforme TaxID=63214 RepID=UPI0020C68B78|nr:ARM repeat-containing protein [Hypoxylon fragiforme]KAI2607600.1 ARM repeat-containing protein [Hypoxylon fragiforme]
MATNGGAQPAFGPDEVLQAMLTMRGGDSEKKKKAHEYLELFQKSTTAWTTTVTILQSNAEADVKLFAATTLRGKITYDLSTQVPAAEIPAVRSQLLVLLKTFAPGPKPIRVQLCVCLAILAIQMQEWKDVLPVVVSSLGNEIESHGCILDFLRVLPEEVTEGRKITLTDEELSHRTTELLEQNAPQVVQLLINYAHSSPAAATNPQLFECITSWLREVPINEIVKSPLLNIVFSALESDSSFQAAAECISTMVRETREIDENIETIQILLPRIIALQPKIQKLVAEEDLDSYRSITKLFGEVGAFWAVAIAREPSHFRPLVDAILECAARDKDREVIEFTFDFWYELKQYLVLEKYIQARMELLDVYAKLVDILLLHLEYPQSEIGDERDLFDGDREAEEKFREFRHLMGDTLKDCCEIMGVSDCLAKVLDAIKIWMQKYASMANGTSVPHWQQLEAPLFSMRAMGRMVTKEESTVLPQLMPLLVQMPAHEKLRFATIMVLGRYTEWTAAHPDFLSAQFSYIVSSFDTDSKEIVRAAAMAIKYFCTDCKHLLSEQVLQLQQFYDQILDKLPEVSQEEITEGVATVVSVQPKEDIYRLLKLFCDPLIQRLMAKANNATDPEKKLAVADHLQLITLFSQGVVVLPPVERGQEDPAVKYWQEVFPILTKVLDSFLDFPPICERVCRCWRFMVISHRGAMAPVLPDMANQLASGFASSRQGCFLWVTGAILREFSDDREHVEQALTEHIYMFFEAQVTNVLRFLSELSPQDLPDVTEDFFRLVVDGLLYYPQKFIPSPIFSPVFEAALSVLVLEQREPLSATLHYIRDVLGWGTPYSPSSYEHLTAAVTEQLRVVVKQLLLTQGETLVKRLLAGMMITFPKDCFADASGALLTLFEIFPDQTATWVDQTLRLLPDGTVTLIEVDRLMIKIKEKLSTNDTGDVRQIRSILQDFTNTYRRRYVAPRDGLGALEGSRFRFAG